MWLETPVGERFSDIRVQQAARTGASYLVTACPFCIVCLEDSAKIISNTEFGILDVSELTLMATKGQ